MGLSHGSTMGGRAPPLGPCRDHVQIEEEDQASAKERRDVVDGHELHIPQEGPAKVDSRGGEVGELHHFVAEA